ncbi:MAG: DNA topoisomerase (ATP-hydrolyzing) subunit A [Exilispira sp.]|jgi:DNA gyrase subunit A|nr:DNA topoisomerase (ATP-hydrolyzing) subunit A [Exilispira sp.]
MDKIDNVNNKITIVPIQDEIENSYLVYSLSVIVGRAIPDIRDGLKPVHRRILYSMYDQSITYDKATKKCARIVGDVLGKYHPHGDQAIYETLVRMAQPFSLRYPLVYGQGNFGSIDGDTPAAMRYTEAKLEKITEQLLGDLDKETVPFRKNFDESLDEPEVLPAQFPNILVNGAEGIAVGMTTSIPPHNLNDVIDSLLCLIDNPSITCEELLRYIKGPDFPTGGIIIADDEMKNMYLSGKGRVLLRARITIEKQEDGEAIIINDIPYQENKALIVKRIAQLARDGVIEEIANLRDESDQRGIRVLIKVKKGKKPEVVIAKLYKYTSLQKYYNANFIAIHQTEPKSYDLKEILKDYFEFRRQIFINKYNYLLRKAKDRLHILEGLLIALDNIDKVIATIRKSQDTTTAKNSLMSLFGLTKIQAEAILDMRLQKLTNLESYKIREEHQQILKEIDRIENILKDDFSINNEIKNELIKIKENFGDERKTKIISGVESEDYNLDVIKEEVVVILTKNGYVKRVSSTKFKTLNRGSKGQKGVQLEEGDTVKTILHGYTTDNLVFITSKGRAYHLMINDIPDSEFRHHGEHITSFLKLEDDENINSINIVNEFPQDSYFIFITKKGIIKKMELALINTRKSTGINCIRLVEGDVVVDSIIMKNDEEVIIVTAFGYICRFSINLINDIGRTAMGVKGVSLSDGDYVVNMTKAEKEKHILIVSEKGYAKRIPHEQIRLTNRGVKGVLCISNREKAGKILTVTNVTKDDIIVLITKKGKTFKTLVSKIKVQNRNTLGIKLLSLDSDDLLSDISKINISEDDEDNQITLIDPEVI